MAKMGGSMGIPLRDAEFAPRGELRARTAPVHDDGSFGRLMVLLPDGRRVAVSGPLVVGSAEEAELTLNVPCVSRRHCVIEPLDERVIVRDLGSTNGTLVNGVRVAHAELRPGVVLTIGTT